MLGRLAGRLPDHDDHQRAEQRDGQLVLVLAARGRAIIGARKMPMARKLADTKNSASCTCHMRDRL